MRQSRRLTEPRENAGVGARAVKKLLAAPVLLYRWNLGRLLGRRFRLLTHVGRRSGRRHATVLEVIGRRLAEGEFMVIAGSAARRSGTATCRRGRRSTGSASGRPIARSARTKPSSPSRH